MKKIILFSLCCLAAVVTYAQPENLRNIILKAKVTDTRGLTTNAYIHSMTDSALYLMNFKKRVYANVERDRLMRVDPEMIGSVNYRKNQQVLKGIGVGLLIGVISGAIIGYASYKRPSADAWFDLGPGVSAAGGALVGGALGSMVGLSVTVGSRKHRINGNMAKYRSMQVSFNKQITRHVNK